MGHICLETVDFSYDEQVVLSDISLTIEAGDFVVVVGPNGAGKSTLLKIMAGLLEPQAGRIVISGEEMRAAQRQGQIAYVPQQYSAHTPGFPATVEEIVELGTVKGHHTRQGKRHIVSHMLELVGATALRTRRIGELSGGQQQRVMVAMALAANPQILLLDEPTSGIDYEASGRIYELLKDLNQNLGITVVMISHDMEKALQYAKKVACINRGLCFYGKSENFDFSHIQTKHSWYYTGR
ncbi:metal ABC transporter ATP-binding protein [Azotosporobacter soli]|uniref:metal ABC transporter ATP-binding protein n=1 Tax=Azotosporobacter soli TaxID=3055040 RepID=UPI0031FEB3B9